VNKELILGLDIGSSSVRGALFDASGRMLPRTLARDERRLTATRDGGAEIDAEKAFRQVVATIDMVLTSAARVKGEIVAVASCTFWHSLMGIDGEGKPTTPVYGWADNRSRKFVEVLRKRFDESETHNRTGARFHSSFWPAKLLWIRKEKPDVWTRTARWISFGDYVSLKLLGAAISSVSMASGTGVFDIRECEWDEKLLWYLKIKKSILPDVAATDDLAFTLFPKWQKRWPRLKDAKWLPPVADGVANNIGSGCVDETKAALMVGTSGAMRVVYEGAPPKRIPSGLWCYRVDRKRVIVGGALSDGGGLYDWLKRNLRIDLSDAAIGKEMSRRGADAHGLTFLPFFAGERSTGYNENATGSILGLTMAHDAIDVLQSAMEAVAFRFAKIFEQLQTVVAPDQIIASGGGLNESPVWTQIIADALGRDLTISNVTESSLRGAVLLALATTGKIELTDTVSAEKNKKITFHPKCSDVYRKARDRHLTAYERTK
jgi:gluconokinase